MRVMRKCLAVVVVLQACLAGLPALAQTGAAAPRPGFTLDRVAEIEIRMSAEDWREVRLSHRNASLTTPPEVTTVLSALPGSADDGYEYRRAEIRIDGVVIAQVGVRKKGFIGSVVSTRPSLKVKFDEYVNGQSYAGLEGLTLNNNNQDQALLQQFLAYDLYTRAGVPAPQTSFARVRVNGEDLGLYTRVETIDKAFLRRVFGNDNGVLYEGYAGDFIGDRSSQIVEKRGGERPGPGRDRPADRGIGRAWAAGVASRGGARRRRRVHQDVGRRVADGPLGQLLGEPEQLLPVRAPVHQEAALHPVGRRLGLRGPGSLAVQAGSQVVQGRGGARSASVGAARDPEPVSSRDAAAAGRPVERVPAARRVADETSGAATPLELPARNRTQRVRAHRDLHQGTTSGGRGGTRGAGPGVAAGPDGIRQRRLPVVVSGSFKAPWAKAAPANPFAGGSATMNVEVAGQSKVTFAQTGAFAVTFDQADPLPAPLREKYQSVSMMGLTERGVWGVTLIIDPFRFESGPGPLPVDGFNVWAIVFTQDGAGPPRLGLFGNTGELRLDEAAARDGGQISGTFTIRATLP